MRRRATSVAAAAPNRRIIGGAGTGTPPVELEEPPLLEAELADEALDALEALEALEPEEPKLLEPPVAPLLDALLPDEAEEALLAELPELPVLPELVLLCGGLGRPPELPELELLELELELALLELALLALDEPPVEVDVEPPDVEVDPPDVDVEPPDVDDEPPDVDVDPPDVETVIVVLPPVELPPTKLPLKKPPPKPKPPELPPTMIGTPPPALLATAMGGGGGGGTNMGGTIVRVVVTRGAGHETRRTVRWTTRRCFDWARRTVAVRAFAWLTTEGRGGGFSATWTAPPPMMAPPQVQAQSFARAILTDITSILFLAASNKGLAQYSSAAGPGTQMQILAVGGKRVNHLGARKRLVLPALSEFRPITEQDCEGSEGQFRKAWAASGRERADSGRRCIDSRLARPL